MVDRSVFAVDENWKNRRKYNISNKQDLLQTYTHAIFNNIWSVLCPADSKHGYYDLYVASIHCTP